MRYLHSDKRLALHKILSKRKKKPLGDVGMVAKIAERMYAERSSGGGK